MKGELTEESGLEKSYKPSLLSNILYYIQGKLRYKVYYSKAQKLFIRKHIREQIAWRIKVMNPDCYSEGSCQMCGCETTALQMANKTCPKPCYPKMMNRKNWEEFKKKYYICF